MKLYDRLAEIFSENSSTLADSNVYNSFSKFIVEITEELTESEDYYLLIHELQKIHHFVYSSHFDANINIAYLNKVFAADELLEKLFEIM